MYLMILATLPEKNIETMSISMTSSTSGSLEARDIFTSDSWQFVINVMTWFLPCSEQQAKTHIQWIRWNIEWLDLKPWSVWPPGPQVRRKKRAKLAPGMRRFSLATSQFLGSDSCGHWFNKTQHECRGVAAQIPEWVKNAHVWRYHLQNFETKSCLVEVPKPGWDKLWNEWWPSPLPTIEAPGFYLAQSHIMLAQ